jgi:retinol-binding protein 3
MRRTAALAAMVMLVLATRAQGQQTGNFPIDAAYRARILDGVAEKFGEGYFNEERASFVGAQLRSPAVRATYDTATTAASLSAMLTADLQRWSADRHPRLVFSVQPRPMPRAGKQSPALQDAEDESARSRNFGFHALERLTGNIGYLEIGRFDEIGRFEAPALAGPTLAAAMQFLQNTDALIIDLRGNGGGRADMVALMTSYFLEEQTRLLTLERRNRDESDQVWSASYVPGPRYLGKPVYVLTSKRTFSAAEGLTYDLKHFASATIVGEKTRGGANPGMFQQIDEHFAVFVPSARVVHAATGTNWDADGITPDVAVDVAEAKHTAHRLALERLIAGKNDVSRAAMWNEALNELFPAQTR